MPSNYTEHFKLSQWERPDKVLMDDFNDDNQKIENAFFNHSSAELICSKTVDSEGVFRLEADISQVNWSRYMMVLISVEMNSPSRIELQTNNGSTFCVSILQSFSNHDGSNTALAQGYASRRLLSAFFPLYSGDTYPLFLTLGGVRSPQTSDYPASISCGSSDYQLKNISSICAWKQGNTFQLGDRIVLWGIK